MTKLLITEISCCTKSFIYCKIVRNDNTLPLFLIFYQKIIDFTLPQLLWQAKNKREGIL